MLGLVLPRPASLHPDPDPHPNPTSTLTPTLTLTLTPTLTPTLTQALGLQLFTAIATLSTLLFWTGFSSGRVRVAVACAAVGLLGPVLGHRTLALT